MHKIYCIVRFQVTVCAESGKIFLQKHYYLLNRYLLIYVGDSKVTFGGL